MDASSLDCTIVDEVSSEVSQPINGHCDDLADKMVGVSESDSSDSETMMECENLSLAHTSTKQK